jgi:hypothetical protein
MAEEAQSKNHIRLVGMIAGMGSGKLVPCHRNILNVPCSLPKFDRFDQGGYTFAVPGSISSRLQRIPFRLRWAMGKFFPFEGG